MAERELLEKYWRRAVEQRTSKPLGAADDSDQSALEQRAQHPAHGDAANLLDLGSSNRLAIGDDRERLERGRGEARGTRCELRALDRLGVLGARQNLPAAAELDELDAVALGVVSLTHLVERAGELVGARGGVECCELARGEWASAREERGLKQLR